MHISATSYVINSNYNVSIVYSITMCFHSILLCQYIYSILLYYACVNHCTQKAGVSINFINNSAELRGGAIYVSDLRLCSWVGNDYPIYEYTIFELPDEIAYLSPFKYM